MGIADEPGLLVVSDSHLSPKAPGAVLNWGAVAQYAVARKPDARKPDILHVLSC